MADGLWIMVVTVCGSWLWSVKCGSTVSQDICLYVLKAVTSSLSLCEKPLPLARWPCGKETSVENNKSFLAQPFSAPALGDQQSSLRGPHNSMSVCFLKSHERFKQDSFSFRFGHRTTLPILRSHCTLSCHLCALLKPNAYLEEQSLTSLKVRHWDSLDCHQFFYQFLINLSDSNINWGSKGKGDFFQSRLVITTGNNSDNVLYFYGAC